MPNYQELHVLRLWILFSPDTANCPAQIITAVSLWSCMCPVLGSAVWKVKKQKCQTGASEAKKAKKMCVQVYNKWGEKCFGPQDWMSSPAGLGPGVREVMETPPGCFWYQWTHNLQIKHADLLPFVLLLSPSCTINSCRAGIKVKTT